MSHIEISFIGRIYVDDMLNECVVNVCTSIRGLMVITDPGALFIHDIR